VPTNAIYLGLGSNLQINSGFTLDPNRTVVLRGGIITVAGSQTLQVPGKVTTDVDSFGTFTKSGAGTLILSGTGNDYIGATTVSAGTLQLGASNALPTVTALNVANTAGAVLDLNSFSQTVGSLTGGGSSGGAILLGSGTLTIGNGTASSFGGVISGTGGLVVQGGSLTLSGTDTYSGGTVVNNGGSIKIGADSNLGANTGPLTLNGGTLNSNSNLTLDPARPLILGPAGGTINTVNAGQAFTFNGIISGPGSLTMTQSAINGTITLGGQNTYAGSTTLSTRNLVLTVDNTLPPTTALILPTSGNVLIDGQGKIQTFASLSGGASGIIYNLGLTATGGTLKVGDATSTTYAGVLNGVGTVVKQGSGTLTISANNTSNLTARWVLNGGVLQISSDNNLGQTISASVATPDTITFNGGALSTTTTLTLNARRGLTLGTGGSLTVATGTTLTFAGPITGGGSLTLPGPGTLALGSTAGTPSDYTGPTYLNGGTLKLTSANALSTATTVVLSDTSATTWNLNGFSQTVAGLAGGAGGGPGGININITLGTGTLTLNNSGQSVFTGAISGSGIFGLIRTGSGVQTLTGANTYTGATQIQGGVLLINGSTSASSAVTVSGGVLGGSGSVNGSVTVSGSGTVTAGSQFVPGALTTGALTFNGGTYQWKVAQMPSGGTAGSGWDVLHINGALTLGASETVQIAAPSGVAGWNPSPATVQQWPIATFTGGLSGSLANVGVDQSLFPMPLGPGYNFYLTNDATTLYANYYLYTPVPEPGALFLLAGVAGVVAGLVRRGYSVARQFFPFVP
jgi:autotransporter-associated beta strand protein